VAAEYNELVTRQDSPEPLFSFNKRKVSQVFTVLKHQVEGLIKQSWRNAFCKKLKTRAAVRPDRNELTVDHGIAFRSFESARATST
jgi:hypothetical protein